MVVHRDFHSRNLISLEDGALGVLDFQDALHGPITYDLVSLLRDCYAAWPEEQVLGLSERFRRRLRQRGIDIPASRWRRWFDLMGMQRHLKTIGIFCRLALRDGRFGYLRAVPRTLGYVEGVARRYPELRVSCSGIIKI